MKTLTLSQNGASANIRQSIRECYDVGIKSESFVKNLLLQMCGGTVCDASTEEDKYKHIDLWWDSPKGGRLGIDVKGLRKKKRSDVEYDDSIQWLEITNVCGFPGWIYGEMDYVAFVTKHDVLFVRPSALVELVGREVDTNAVSHVNPRADYVAYQRQGRRDLIVRVPTDDIRPLAHFTLCYDT